MFNHSNINYNLMIRAAGQLTFRTRIRSHLHELIYENRNFRKLRVGKFLEFLQFFHLASNRISKNRYLIEHQIDLLCNLIATW